MRWEYKVLHFTNRSFFTGEVNTVELSKVLNELGREGWEMVSGSQSRMQKMVIVLKRPS